MTPQETPQVPNYPVLKDYKGTVGTMLELYAKYPNGGEYGWWAFVYTLRAFSCWNVADKKWDELNSGSKDRLLSGRIEVTSRTTSTPLNQLLAPGIYAYNETTTQQTGILIISLWNQGGYQQQIAYDNGIQYKRTNLSNDWSDWDEETPQRARRLLIDTLEETDTITIPGIYGLKHRTTGTEYTLDVQYRGADGMQQWLYETPDSVKYRTKANNASSWSQWTVDDIWGIQQY